MVNSTSRVFACWASAQGAGVWGRGKPAGGSRKPRRGHGEKSGGVCYDKHAGQDQLLDLLLI